jgi:succinate-semialdehyde dehydrogenase/glutarate-semialdehyde dehydrogenase
MKAINPATEELLRDYPEPDAAEVAACLTAAEAAFAAWRKVPFAERSRLMSAAADLLRERRDEYGRLMTEEMGKPLAAAESEVARALPMVLSIPAPLLRP